MAIPLQAERRPGEETEDELLRTVSSRLGGGGRLARADPPRVSGPASLKEERGGADCGMVWHGTSDYCRRPRIPILAPVVAPRCEFHRRPHDADHWRLCTFTDHVC
jgi:hypothetical protein